MHVFCSVLQCVKVCGSVLQCVAACCRGAAQEKREGASPMSVHIEVEVCCSVLQCVAVFSFVCVCDMSHSYVCVACPICMCV